MRRKRRSRHKMRKARQTKTAHRLEGGDRVICDREGDDEGNKGGA